MFSTHMPWEALPDPIKNDSSSKVVYFYRNPKDVFVSIWHFANNLRPEEIGSISIAEAFELFCNGVVAYGPYWDHVLDYWRRSKENPDRILFIMYEEMKEQPGMCLRRLAEFLDSPFSPTVEKSGFVDEILNLCSFESLSILEVNKSGKLTTLGQKNSAFFRWGKVGDWNNYLSNEMVQKLDRIIEDKFSGSGLVMSSSLYMIF